MLQRLFCLGSSHHVADGEWVVARTQHHQTHASYTASKILDIVEAEVDERFKSTKASKRAALEPNSMRRLHRANLPMEDSQRATEIISKLTSIDNSKLRFQKEFARMEQELADAKEEKRLAEFGQARAEQLAIARWEALYGCQERLAEAERQQVQLADVLKLTLDKLGMGLTPSPAPLSHHEYERSPGQLLDRPAGPLFASGHGGAVNPSSTMMLAPLQTELETGQEHKKLTSSSSEPDTPLSGFTVYSNELHDSPERASLDVQRLPRSGFSPQDNNNDARIDAAAHRYPHHLENLRPSSATKWKDISEVAYRNNSNSSSQSPECATPLGASNNINNNGSLIVASGVDTDTEAERLAQLIIPHLQASQLESLVRFGASLGSPTLASPTMQRHLLDALRKSRNEEQEREEERRNKQQQVVIQQQLQPVMAQQMTRSNRAHAQAENAVAPAVHLPAAAPLVPPPRPAMPQQRAGYGPLSQASGWASPGLNGASTHHHIKTVFENATTSTDGGVGQNGFYKPFSAAAIASETEHKSNKELRDADALAMPAPPPRKSTFKLGAAHPSAAYPGPALPSSSVDSDGERIKAVMMPGQGNNGVPDDDRFARQRRAAERLAAKINSKLPPEYQTADPLGLGSKGQVRSRTTTDGVSASIAASSTSAGSGARKPPKGSLRRQQAEAFAADAVKTSTAGQ